MGTSLTAISIRAFFDKVEPRTLAIVVNLLMILAERPDTLTSLQPRGDGFRVPAPLRHSPLQPERSQATPSLWITSTATPSSTPGPTSCCSSPASAARRSEACDGPK